MRLTYDVSYSKHLLEMDLSRHDIGVHHWSTPYFIDDYTFCLHPKGGRSRQRKLGTLEALGPK